MDTADRQSTRSAGDWLKAQKPIVRAPVAGAVGVGLASGVLLIVQVALLAFVINAVVFGDAGPAAVAWPLAAFGGVVLARAALAYAMAMVNFRIAATVKRDVRDRLLARIAKLGPVGDGDRSSGDRVNTVVDGVEKLEAFYGRYLPQTTLAVLVPLAILVVVAPIDWISGLILALTAPLIPFFMILIGRGTERLNQRQWRRMGWLSGHFLDALHGLTTLKLFNLGRREAKLIERLSEDYRRATMRVLRLAFVSSLVMEFLATVSIAMVAVLIGFRLLWGDIGFEAGFVVLLLAPEFYGPLRNMGTVYHARMEAVGAAEEIAAVLDAEPATAAGVRQDVPASAPEVVLDSVSFGYRADQPVIDDFDLTLAAGETVAFVGPSGSGKSTLAWLTLGLLQPDNGLIRIDDVPLADYAPAAWHRATAWIPQSPGLFYGSVRDNLTLGVDDCPDSRLWRALERSQAADFVAARPGGLDAAVGDRGAGLSGGEAQRLAIARALVRDAPFVVVDEASAHLDGDNEQRLLAALADLTRDRTALLIAHRRASLGLADRVVRVEAAADADPASVASPQAGSA
ncbi:thiol reductant ABC exporter subunit CydD [Salinisphaera orenii]|uniref:thiol reductant ABC exporter subunit CydD n=1 Tax=Salinisphaera orenii TaxID=856731 RepID=UPI000DBE61E8